MSGSVKIEVLGVGEIESGTNDRGGKWNRRTLQIWTGEIAGNHPFYGEEEKLNQLRPGTHMATIGARAGNRGRLEYAILDIQPVTKANHPA